MGVSHHGEHDDALSTVGATDVGEQVPSAKAAPLSLLSPTGGTRASVPLGGSQRARLSRAVGQAACWAEPHAGPSG
jgi:hypothetical protein